MSSHPARGSAGLAKARLLGDRAVAPLAEQRARLAILTERLERAARSAVADALAGRVRAEPRLGPLLGQLMRKALTS